MSDLTAAKHHLKKSKSLLQMDDLKCMKRVLRRLGYCSTSDVIEVKGRIACELSSADELLLTEMMFNGVFNPLNPPQVRTVERAQGSLDRNDYFFYILNQYIT